jgi:hypothetical protein
MKDDKISVIEEEAERVRLIFRRYLELGGVNALVRDREEDIRTKARQLATGATRVRTARRRAVHLHRRLDGREIRRSTEPAQTKAEDHGVAFRAQEPNHQCRGRATSSGFTLTCRPLCFLGGALGVGFALAGNRHQHFALAQCRLLGLTPLGR